MLGSSSDDVVLELELQWASGADFVLAAYVFGVRVPVRLSDVQLVAAVRVHFTPLVDELPCLGGLEVSLLGMPDHLDLAAVVPPGVDLMALPAMDVLLPWILRKILGPMFVYPSRMIIPIMDNSGLEPHATGMIKVRVRGGAGNGYTGYTGARVHPAGLEDPPQSVVRNLSRPNARFPAKQGGDLGE